MRRNALLSLTFLVLFIACKEPADTAIPKLRKQLSSKESGIRNRAALKLAGYGIDAEPAVPQLTKLLSDPNSGVKTSAAFALRSIDTEEARKALEIAEGRNGR